MYAGLGQESSMLKTEDLTLLVMGLVVLLTVGFLSWYQERNQTEDSLGTTAIMNCVAILTIWGMGLIVTT